MTRCQNVEPNGLNGAVVFEWIKGDAAILNSFGIIL